MPGGEIHVPFPASLLVYPAGGIILEIILRLFLIPLFVWLVSIVLLGGRWQAAVFWGAAALVALLEPLGVVGPVLQTGNVSWRLALLFAASYVFNLVSAYVFRQFGFLATVNQRLSFYLVWHILFGALT